jgi:hypothetical protein
VPRSSWKRLADLQSSRSVCLGSRRAIDLLDLRDEPRCPRCHRGAHGSDGQQTSRTRRRFGSRVTRRLTGPHQRYLSRVDQGHEPRRSRCAWWVMDGHQGRGCVPEPARKGMQDERTRRLGDGPDPVTTDWRPAHRVDQPHSAVTRPWNSSATVGPQRVALRATPATRGDTALRTRSHDEPGLLRARRCYLRLRA